jgi:hypothetical protein
MAIVKGKFRLWRKVFDQFMGIDELRNIIKKHGITFTTRSTITGCKLLEHIEDVPRFVLLLRKFYKLNNLAYDTLTTVNNRNFVDDHPDVIKFILNSNVIFGMNGKWVYAYIQSTYYGIEEVK